MLKNKREPKQPLKLKSRQRSLLNNLLMAHHEANHFSWLREVGLTPDYDRYANLTNEHLDLVQVDFDRRVEEAERKFLLSLA